MPTTRKLINFIFREFKEEITGFKRRVRGICRILVRHFMKIMIAGATGAVGKRLVPMLVAGGHYVVATTRSPRKLDELCAQGAESAIMDGLDENAVRKTVESYRPEVIVHEMTALGSMRSLKHFDDEFTVTNQLRTKGTEVLLAAARASGAQKFIAQSYADGRSSAAERESKLKTIHSILICRLR